MTGSKRFEKLLEPGYIGSVKTRNRMIKSGATLLYWHEEEIHMNEVIKSFYDALARGGVGLLIVEAPDVDYPIGRRWQQRYRIDDDKYIVGMAELATIIHKHGCPTFMQMNHDGNWQTKWGPVPIIDGPPVAASPVTINSMSDFHNEMPRELTIPEIEEVVDKFANAAVRAEKAGFDGVDINAASSHLLHNFLSPFWNRRQDIYGGSMENRARMLVNIIKEIKKRLGQDFPVSIIINGIEIGQAIGVSNDECMTAEYSRGIARLLQAAGADAIQVRSHWLGHHIAGFLNNALFYPEPPIPLESFPKEYNWSQWGKGANIFLAAEMKKALSIPVTIVGTLGPELGERVLQENKADFIAMTRSLQADPELPNKVASGRLEDVAPCTRCDTCLSNARGNRGCRINAALGTDDLWEIKPAVKKKRVVIAGGGPAGMEAARVAALRGHEVTLYEKSDKLGGSLPMAAVVKGLRIEDLPAIVRYLKGQITKLGVKIRLGSELNPSVVEEIKPDVVILATGGIPTTPEIAGIDNRKVISGQDLHRRLKFYLRFIGPKTMRWLTSLFMPIGKRVVIIGGGIQGCELGEFLVKRGRKVTILDTTEMLGEGMINHLRASLLSWFNKKGVTMLTEVKYEAITDKGLSIITKEGKRKTIEADSIIPALPLTPDTVLLKSLEGKAPEVYTVGDCNTPGLIVDAIAESSRLTHGI